MKIFSFVVAFLLLSSGGYSQAPSPKVKLTVLLTGTANPLEMMTFKGGSAFKKFPMAHPAFLIEHPQGNFLFDTGLGKKAKEQVQEMTWWARIATHFTQRDSAAEQLQKMGIKLDRIIVSHVHFDHVSGLADFPGTPVEALKEEVEFTKIKGASTAVLASTFDANTNWQIYELQDKEYEGYKKSRDIFGDGTLVLVGMPGHTPGSVGLFVNISPDKRIFLVGDTVWNSAAISKALPKFWVARVTADNKPDEVMERILELKALRERNPHIMIIPGHDAAAIETLNK
ncbi:MBL fold metallo-hydrolase [Bdellovibrio sp. HCB2-146]|uniref:MBL fold metallo-hydrolase n=1 Tax=Bdellovibrio sp. HCB2-146 TaxID=3394362 RepID=UPI0039BC8439